MMPAQRIMRNIEHFHSYENMDENSAYHNILEEEKVMD